MEHDAALFARRRGGQGIGRKTHHHAGVDVLLGKHPKRFHNGADSRCVRQPVELVDPAGPKSQRAGGQLHILHGSGAVCHGVGPCAVGNRDDECGRVEGEGVVGIIPGLLNGLVFDLALPDLLHHEFCTGSFVQKGKGIAVLDGDEAGVLEVGTVGGVKTGSEDGVQSLVTDLPGEVAADAAAPDHILNDLVHGEDLLKKCQVGKTPPGVDVTVESFSDGLV